MSSRIELPEITHPSVSIPFGVRIYSEILTPLTAAFASYIAGLPPYEATQIGLRAGQTCRDFYQWSQRPQLPSFRLK